MKIKLLVLFLSLTVTAHAQYFQRSFNLDYVTPQFRDEFLNSGIRTRVNYANGSPANYYHVGIGVSRLNSALASPYNRADWVRFIRLSKSGTVNNNRGLEFYDAATNKKYNAEGNSIAEISTSTGTGGYIAVGKVADNSITGVTVPGGSDALYTVLSNSGNVSSAYRIDFGGTYDIAWCIRHSAFVAGSWLVCGEVTHFPLGTTPYTDCFIARLDAAGNIAWCATYNFDPTVTGGIPSANCFARQLAEDPATGDIYVVGFLKDFTGTNGADGLIFKVTSAGAFVGSLLYHAAPDDQFHCIRFTKDGNIAVGGFTSYNPGAVTPFYNMLLLKVSPAGAILFQKLLKVQNAAGTVVHESKCYDLIERVRPAPNSVQYFLYGPAYLPAGTFQTVYKTNSMGSGINSYIYNQMKFDQGFGIDYADNSFAKPGAALFSSVINSSGTFSDSHIMKTYFNGAACTNYCPANPPLTVNMQIQPPGPQPIMTQSCTIKGIKAKSFNFQSLLNCSQNNIGCGSNAKAGEGPSEFARDETDMISIYPNPATSALTIDVKLGEEGNYQLDVMSVSGQLLVSKEVEGLTSTTIDISQFPPGPYLVMIRYKDVVLRKLFIKE